MEPSSSIQLQLGVKRNAEELQDYLKDLQNWEEDIKKEDEKLKNKLAETTDLPPIRSCFSKKETKKKNKSKANNGDVKNGKKAQRLSGLDYSSWDKFDVDKALSEIDTTQEQVETTSEDTETSEDEELEIMRMKQKAILDKDRGNEYFKNKNYDEAIACYTSGIECDPCNALLPANRAMALIKKGQFAAAEKDSDLSLSLDPTYIKAYHRRGTARFGLKKYELAKADFEKVLSLHPDNKEAKQELEKIEQILSLSTCQSQKSTNNLQKNVSKISELKPSEKQVKDSNTYDSIPDNNQTTEPGPSGHKSYVVTELNKGAVGCSENEEQEKGMKEQEIGDSEKNLMPTPLLPLSSVVTPIFIPPHLRSKKPLRRLDIEDVDSDSEEWSRFNTVLKEQKNACSSFHTIAQSGNARDIVHAGGDRPLSLHVASPVNLSAVTSPTPPSLPGVPTTSYQFLADWKRLKQWPEMLCDYIKQIPPDKLPKIFKESLESELFSAILRIMTDYFIPKEIDIFPYLKFLSKVGRFSTLVLFLSDDDSKALNVLFKYINSLKRYPDEEVRQLMIVYGVS